MYAVVRLRGNVNISAKIKDSLKMLNLDNKFTCTLLPESPDYEGMLEKVRDFVTWGKVKEGTALKILERNGVDEPEEIINGLEEGKSLSEIGLDKDLSLSPPSGGFKGSFKEQYPKGEAGYREDEINSLIERMV